MAVIQSDAALKCLGAHADFESRRDSKPHWLLTRGAIDETACPSTRCCLVDAISTTKEQSVRDCLGDNSPNWDRLTALRWNVTAFYAVINADCDSEWRLAQYSCVESRCQRRLDCLWRRRRSAQGERKAPRDLSRSRTNVQSAAVGKRAVPLRHDLASPKLLVQRATLRHLLCIMHVLRPFSALLAAVKRCIDNVDGNWCNAGSQARSGQRWTWTGRGCSNNADDEPDSTWPL